jgi:hypothetical protein
MAKVEIPYTLYSTLMPDAKYSGRILTIYFPTAKELKKLQDAALACRMPHAHFALEMIRRGMDMPTTPSAGLQDTRDELAMARMDLKEKNARIKQLETDLFTLKSSLFSQPSPEGRSSLSSELVELLQDGHTWRPADIMARLGIDAKNIDAITSLAGQLHALQDLKMVEETTNGWRWIG